MKKIMKKLLPLMLVAGVLAMSGVQVSCKSSSDNMYQRQQSNRAKKIKSNIKVKGTNKSHGHTNRTY
jgi:Tfp pilus assembly protein PilV